MTAVARSIAIRQELTFRLRTKQAGANVSSNSRATRSQHAENEGASKDDPRKLGPSERKDVGRIAQRRGNCHSGRGQYRRSTPIRLATADREHVRSRGFTGREPVAAAPIQPTRRQAATRPIVNWSTRSRMFSIISCGPWDAARSGSLSKGPELTQKAGELVPTREGLPRLTPVRVCGASRDVVGYMEPRNSPCQRPLDPHPAIRSARIAPDCGTRTAASRAALGGSRCGERAFLELHLEPYAVGGGATLENIELRCARTTRTSLACSSGLTSCERSAPGGLTRSGTS